MLVTADMVKQMKPGSVVVDLAAESGGNVEGVLPGDVSTVDGVSSGAGQRPQPDARPGQPLYARTSPTWSC